MVLKFRLRPQVLNNRSEELRGTLACAIEALRELSLADPSQLSPEKFEQLMQASEQIRICSEMARDEMRSQRVPC